MTEHEFMAGWKLLLLQPWAHRYRGQNEFGEPSRDAREQQAFYFEHVKTASGGEWYTICKEHAKGKEWPSVDMLKRSLSSVRTYSPRVVDPEGGPMLSLDEFGGDLYDAIRLQSAQIQEEKNAKMYEKQGLTGLAKTSLKNADRLRDELTEIFQRDTLSPEDLRRVLEMGNEQHV